MVSGLQGWQVFTELALEVSPWADTIIFRCCAQVLSSCVLRLHPDIWLYSEEWAGFVSVAPSSYSWWINPNLSPVRVPRPGFSPLGGAIEQSKSLLGSRSPAGPKGRVRQWRKTSWKTFLRASGEPTNKHSNEMEWEVWGWGSSCPQEGPAY